MKRLYRTYEDSTKIFKEFQKRFPKNFELSSIGKTWEKRDINLITISSDIESAHEKPALFYTGTIHAREWIGHELAIEFTEYILNNINIDPTLESYLKSATIYIVPCANPDGFTYSQTHFSFWRKNRRVNADGTYGVDLNRNFSIGFIKSTQTTSNIYGGPEPFSEPETQALKKFVETHENITIALDYHSQGNVFFPAHDFRHEDTIETTDLNILCANMADKIKKISNREYGIHQGKPPAKLIGGSGREFYFSKGILSTVVEVGTRNISDYLDDMNEHIREHIPALIEALKEVPNYDKKNSLQRVENFEVEEIGSNHVNLKWDSKISKDIFFEIYRNKKDKMSCKESNLIGRTQASNFYDTNLQSNTNYYFNIRAVNKRKKLKSPFPPQIKIRTHVEYDEYSRTYYANATQTGYVAENINNNEKHFGVNSLFVGVDENKGVSYSIITIDLKTIPKNAVIKSASLNLYPINRVSTTIEKFGEWNIAIIDQNSIEDVTDFDEVENAKVISYIGRPTKSDQLTQGIWRKWELSGIESLALTSQIEKEKVIFRVEGPKELKVGRKSQMMQWDIGYGKFGFGLTYRPRLELTYTIEPTINKLYAKSIHTISKEKILENEVNSGFDENGNKIYCALEFNLSSLPSYEYTIITNAYIELNTTNNYIKDDIRFHLEFVENNTKKSYSSITKRKIIQNIGYDVSANDLKNNKTQYFVFDSYAKMELNERLKDKSNIMFVLKPTSSIKAIKNKKISWEISNDKLAPKLVVEYIPKRRFPLNQVSNAKYEIENGKIKISWENPKEEDLVGIKVIKNPYRKPLSSHDGQKIYAGKDNYTYDEFGAKDKNKYFAIFTYDDVPNYSEPIILEYKAT
ncbi:peptidase [Malaciobacter molluscorum LMG 25693]|uniref:carboxypeptidase T n=1 Tax=Malaciobacter molluscorum LMG 25693 TaxID=870501 RepID=A0A2G1DI61_9BACT|nr:M14 family zinc carboxypeptidase [Malaciobacter molluscorum]AXX92357.1 zinc carboxypeptidase, M14 family [Malaciobacter molluscorum LMG 25693]PHO18192.1 peptidase [Malaciobacter molluscorum LMG 25693]RXJ93981.1 peptidase [Malaciobacter molluscorum]